METKQTIIDLLLSVKREGIDNLIDYLCKSDFFEAPASAKYHGACVGGLAKHSLNVYSNLKDFQKRLTLDCPGEGIIIAALLHDVCKIGAYVRTKADDGWTNNRDKEKGHALLSIERIKKHIQLTEIEELMIKYHMGVYGLNEYDEKSGEYPLRGDESKSKEERYGKSLANAWYHNPIVKIMYFCDELATLQEK
jgi:23S rRNA maturation-related 3'-5' exoribonuclease YhaM